MRVEPAHDNEERWTNSRAGWELDALEIIAEELKRLRVLKEHELGVRLEHDAGGPYVPEAEKERAVGRGYPLRSPGPYVWLSLRPVTYQTSK